jgi:hypothetical protein
MNKKLIPILLVILIASLAFIFGDGDGDKAPLKPVKIVDYKAIVYGPALNGPLSTLSESFEGTTFPPAGWIQINPISGTTGWYRILDGTTPVPGFNGGYISVPPGGGTAVAFGNYLTGNNGGSSGPCEQWLITPPITGVNPNDSLTFWLRKFGNYIDNFYVKISTTTPDIAGMTTTVSSLTFAATDSGWVQYKYKIGNLVPAGSNIYIGFREYDADITSEGASFSLDLVNVTSSDAYPLNAFNLLTPTAGVTILTLPGSTTPVSITWDTSATGATYKWKYVSTSGPSKSLTIPAETNSINTTSGALDVLLAGIGLNQGDSTIGQWDVWAYKSPAATGPDSLKSTNGPRAITLKRQKPALTAFNLISPAAGSRIVTVPGSTVPVNFNWTRSGAGTTYKWLYKTGGSYSDPATLRLPSNNSGFDTVLTMTLGQLDSYLAGLGLNLGDSIMGYWRVRAYNSTDSLNSSVPDRSITLKRALFSSSVFSGSIATGDPVFIRPNGNSGNSATPPTVLSSYSVLYKTTMFTVSNSGEYYIYMGASYDCFIALYQGTFNPANGLTNCIGANDDTLGTWMPEFPVGSLNRSAISYITLNSGTNYIVVSTAYNTGTGNWKDSIYGPGIITIITNVQQVGNIVPTEYKLSQNYPNPFNPTTKINFAIPKQGFVNLKIYDVLGREVRTLVSEVKTPGNYIVDFNAEELSSGVYFYKLSAGSFTDVKRMMLIK